MKSFTGGLMLTANALMFTFGDPSWTAVLVMAVVSFFAVVLIVDDL